MENWCEKVRAPLASWINIHLSIILKVKILSDLYLDSIHKNYADYSINL